jgi:hypothetical protein
MVQRSRNYCCPGKAAMHSTFTVVHLHVGLNNTRPLSVAMEKHISQNLALEATLIHANRQMEKHDVANRCFSMSIRSRLKTPADTNTLKDEAQTVLFKGPVRTAL